MDQVTHDNLEAFLSQKGEKPKIIVIYGPTACGKTSLSIEIAKRLETEIISVDARQVYKHLNIGTGKVTPEEMQGIVHHMLDIIELDRVYSVVDFQREAEEHMRNILAKGKIPILCGGTGLYIDSLVFERSYSESTIDWDLRDELEAYRLTHGNEALWKKLHAIDPSYAETLHINNYRYVIRGIEVFTKTGISK
jgi:tRNA dimethylallyltransferase